MATQGKAAEPVELAERRLLRIEEVADRLAVSRSMAWKLVTVGQLRSVRIGRAVRVRPADLDAYIVGSVREG
jgi:excisionase family DNA binding protein